MGVLTLLLLPKCSSDLNFSPCPPARDWGSRVSGLVYSLCKFQQWAIRREYTSVYGWMKGTLWTMTKTSRYAISLKASEHSVSELRETNDGKNEAFGTFRKKKHVCESNERLTTYWWLTFLPETNLSWNATRKMSHLNFRQVFYSNFKEERFELSWIANWVTVTWG